MTWECSECGEYTRRVRRPIHCPECGTAGVIFSPVARLTSGAAEDVDRRAAWLEAGFNWAEHREDLAFMQ